MISIIQIRKIRLVFVELVDEKRNIDSQAESNHEIKSNQQDGLRFSFCLNKNQQVTKNIILSILIESFFFFNKWIFQEKDKKISSFIIFHFVINLL